MAVRDSPTQEAMAEAVAFFLPTDPCEALAVGRGWVWPDYPRATAMRRSILLAQRSFA